MLTWYTEVNVLRSILNFGSRMFATGRSHRAIIRPRTCSIDAFTHSARSSNRSFPSSCQWPHPFQPGVSSAPLRPERGLEVTFSAWRFGHCAVFCHKTFRPDDVICHHPALQWHRLTSLESKNSHESSCTFKIGGDDCIRRPVAKNNGTWWPASGELRRRKSRAGLQEPKKASVLTSE